jgi:UDP-N-acetylmuramoyl-tripeptide--D-alanyl-D-alanine ligase
MVAPMKRRATASATGAGGGRTGERRGAAAWLTPTAVARATRGEVLQRGAVCTTVATDTRGDCRGKLFVALRGDRHDAHDHLAAALAAGAGGLLVERVPEALQGRLAERGRTAAGAPAPYVVQVADTGRALLDLAGEHRRRQRARVLAITGSCGKTSTKEWLGAALASAMPTVRSQGSFNNHVGVPLTLFAIGPETRAAVVEVGTNHPGEIATLCEVVRPEVGIVTCVAPAHLEGLGSLAGVEHEKGCLPASLPEHGLCVLNGDDAACRRMAARTAATVQYFSLRDPGADWFATQIRSDGGRTRFLLRGERPVVLPRLGEHFVANALAVLAAATWLGMPEEQVVEALAQAPSAARRLEPKSARGATILDDTYNMNPASARAALHALAAAAVPGARRWVVFGAMRELGADAEALHRELGGAVARGDFERLVCVGAGAAAIADGAVAAGLPVARVHVVADVAAAHDLLVRDLRATDVVLCKASRSVQLDRLVDRLTADGGERN